MTNRYFLTFVLIYAIIFCRYGSCSPRHFFVGHHHTINDPFRGRPVARLVNLFGRMLLDSCGGAERFPNLCRMLNYNQHESYHHNQYEYQKPTFEVHKHFKSDSDNCDDVESDIFCPDDEDKEEDSQIYDEIYEKKNHHFIESSKCNDECSLQKFLRDPCDPKPKPVDFGSTVLSSFYQRKNKIDESLLHNFDMIEPNEVKFDSIYSTPKKVYEHSPDETQESTKVKSSELDSKKLNKNIFKCFSVSDEKVEDSDEKTVDDTMVWVIKKNNVKDKINGKTLKVDRSFEDIKNIFNSINTHKTEEKIQVKDKEENQTNFKQIKEFEQKPVDETVGILKNYPPNLGQNIVPLEPVLYKVNTDDHYKDRKNVGLSVTDCLENNEKFKVNLGNIDSDCKEFSNTTNPIPTDPDDKKDISTERSSDRADETENKDEIRTVSGHYLTLVPKTFPRKIKITVQNSGEIQSTEMHQNASSLKTETSEVSSAEISDQLIETSTTLPVDDTSQHVVEKEESKTNCSREITAEYKINCSIENSKESIETLTISPVENISFVGATEKSKTEENSIFEEDSGRTSSTVNVSLVSIGTESDADIVGEAQNVLQKVDKILIHKENVSKIKTEESEETILTSTSLNLLDINTTTREYSERYDFDQTQDTSTESKNQNISENFEEIQLNMENVSDESIKMFEHNEVSTHSSNSFNQKFEETQIVDANFESPQNSDAISTITVILNGKTYILNPETKTKEQTGNDTLNSKNVFESSVPLQTNEVEAYSEKSNSSEIELHPTESVENGSFNENKDKNDEIIEVLYSENVTDISEVSDNEEDIDEYSHNSSKTENLFLTKNDSNTLNSSINFFSKDNERNKTIVETDSQSREMILNTDWDEISHTTIVSEDAEDINIYTIQSDDMVSSSNTETLYFSEESLEVESSTIRYNIFSASDNSDKNYSLKTVNNLSDNNNDEADQNTKKVISVEKGINNSKSKVDVEISLSSGEWSDSIEMTTSIRSSSEIDISSQRIEENNKEKEFEKLISIPQLKNQNSTFADEKNEKELSDQKSKSSNTDLKNDSSPGFDTDEENEDLQIPSLPFTSIQHRKRAKEEYD